MEDLEYEYLREYAYLESEKERREFIEWQQEQEKTKGAKIIVKFEEIKKLKIENV